MTAPVRVTDARLVSETEIHVAFSEGKHGRVRVDRLPFVTGSATAVAVTDAGDKIRISTDGGDFDLHADEVSAVMFGEPIGDEVASPSIGANLRRVRTAAGFSLADLSAATGIAIPNLSRLESGRVTPRLETLERLASGIGVPVATLVREGAEHSKAQPTLGRSAVGQRSDHSRSVIDWANVLDFGQALRNVSTDVVGDWHRDPWGWPELAWAVHQQPTALVTRLNERGTRAASLIDVPKENFTTRPAIVMDPIDRLAYQALVDYQSLSLIGSLRPWVYGWRLPTKEPASGHYSKGSFQWKQFRRHLSARASMNAFALKSDITSFFASIPIDQLIEVASSRAKSGRPIDRMAELVRGWSELPGRSGLAQRSMGSSILANMYLLPVDVLLDAHTRRSSRLLGSPVVRWMDDIWVFGDAEAKLRATQVALQSLLRDLGLNMNTAKTKVLEGVDVARAVNEIEHSAIDQALEADSTEPLESLIERLVAEPAFADRTSIRFVTTRIRDHGLWQFVPTLVQVASRMPQSADHFARLFRDSGQWRELGPWYVDYWTSPWAAIDWSVAQFGTMFPSDAKPPSGLIDHMATALLHHPPLSICSLAAQRLAAWDSDVARTTIRAAVATSSDPAERRVFALASLGIGEERSFVRRLLSEFEENRVTLDLLESRDFAAPAIVRDYAG